MKFTQEIKSAIRNIQRHDRNLPITICVVEIGAVKRSCSVLVLLSSLKVFIVRIGRITISTKSISEKYGPVSLEPIRSVHAPNTIALSERATAKNT